MEEALSLTEIIKQKFFFFNRDILRNARKFKTCGEKLKTENQKEFQQLAKKLVQLLEKELDAVRFLERMITLGSLADNTIVISSDESEETQSDIRAFLLPTSTPLKQPTPIEGLSLTPIHHENAPAESAINSKNKLVFEDDTISKTETSMEQTLIAAEKVSTKLLNVVPIVNGEKLQSRKRSLDDASSDQKKKKLFDDIKKRADDYVQEHINSLKEDSDYLSDKEVSLFLETIEAETKDETDAALSKIESFEDLLGYFDLSSG
ncbi:Oidioi.mRNA.OKI2018_I69.chr1.g2570.t1.cds [Oikopleura dioica]|uniref:Oidioi.mRNA.OKI2018_I69.chr1.g2570.t1.cds n=1 Tax=Oikopleura dioica TaxID=34765 RepID=A0ABN7SWW1_OIKDI|nr:Oidioi.mRNA.OKI2018_I69.chr1.g2570.t1.cds [Oikopleura dioica]